MVCINRFSIIAKCFIVSFAFVATVWPAEALAREQSKEAAAKSKGGRVLGVFGDWSVHVVGRNKNRTCYAVSQPQARLPPGLVRDPAFLFVTLRSSQHSSGEISWRLGYPAKRGVGPYMAVGRFKAAVAARGENAWLRYLAQHDDAVAAMKKGSTLVLRTRSQRGNDLRDEYSLRGFTKAFRLARKHCS